MSKIIIITGPSGSGKTTLTNELLKIYPNLKRIKTHTTREIRCQDDHETYIFLNDKEFIDKVSKNLFIEYEEVYVNVFYGILKEHITLALEDTINNYIICLDVKGASKLKRLLGGDCVSVFCNPNSYDIIKERLSQRENQNNTKERSMKYEFEMSYKDLFDVQIDTSINIGLTLSNFKEKVFGYGK